MNFRLASIAVFVSALSGCAAVGPDFRQPALPEGGYAAAPSQFERAAAAPAIEEGGRVADDWYRLLGSPVIDGLVREALANNPNIEQARASIEQARAELRAVSGADFPQVGVEAAADRIRVNPSALGLSSGPVEGNVFAALFQLSYSIDVFGKRQREREAAQASVDYARAEALNTYIGLVNRVVAAALDLATQQSLMDATGKIVDGQQKQFDILHKREQVGSVAMGQTLTLRARLEATQATMPVLRQRHAAAAAMLAALLGKTPSVFTPPRLSLDDLKMPSTLPASLPSDLVRQRPDILAAEQLLRKTSAEVGVAAANRLPSFTLSADYGSLAQRGANLFNAGNALWVFGGSIAAPLFDGGTLKAREDVAAASYRQAEAAYRATVLGAFAQVATALRALNNDAAALEARDKALRTAQQAMDLSSAQFRVGTFDQFQLLDAELEYRNALLSRVGAQAQRFADVAALMHALGGGWWNAPGHPFATVSSVTQTSTEKH
jgi:NodT family efflux transporter outer membrane factor (OMF) lipoprotein